MAAGHVDHAIRLTASRTDRSFLWPARHQAGAARDPNLPPMGARFRLRGDFDLSPFRPDTRVVLQAMQRHGLIVADNGSNWYFTGTSEPGWDTALLDELKRIPAGAFEAVDASSLMADPESGQVAPPAPATTATTAATTTTTTAPPTTTSAPPPPPAKPSTTTSAPATTAPPTTASTVADTTTTTTTAPAPAADDGTPPGTRLAAAADSGGSRTPWLFAAGFALAGGLGFAAYQIRPRRQTS